MKRTVRLFLLAFLVMSVFAACSGGGESEEVPATSGANDSAAQQPTSAPVEVETTEPLPLPTGTLEPALPVGDSGEQIAALVNGEAITLETFDLAFQRAQQVSTASYDALTDEVLSALIEQKLITQAAADMGLTVTDDEVEAEYQALRSLMPDDAAWQNWLNQNLYNDDVEYRALLKENLISQRVQARIVAVDDLQIAQVHARHIVVGTEEEAQQVLARLDADEDFAQLAAEVSRDVTTKDQGGDLGWFARGDLLTPNLADVAFQLPIGGRGGPVETMLGYHIIQTLEIGQRPATDEERYEMGVIQFNNWLQDRRNQATIERFIN